MTHIQNNVETVKGSQEVVLNGLHPCDHSIAKVNISQPVLYTTAERAKGDTTCAADHTVENLN